MEGFLTFLTLLLLFFSALALLLVQNWRWALIALAVQYLMAFILITSSWPLELAAVKLVTGWMAAAILGFSRINLSENPNEDQQNLPTSPVFLLLSAALVLLIVLGVAPAFAEWARQLSIYQSWGGLLLIGLGLLQLGLGSNSFRTILGLLTLLTGFEILYAAVEESLLVAALLAFLNLGFALVGSYIIMAPRLEERK
jgi:hypothetical protein